MGLDVNKAIEARLRQVFPDMVDWKLCPPAAGTYIIEEYILQDIDDPANPPKPSDEVSTERVPIQLELIFDGVWGGMSPVSHRVYVIVEEL